MTTNNPNDKGIVPRKSLIVKIFGRCIPFTHCYHYIKDVATIEIIKSSNHGPYYEESKYDDEYIDEDIKLRWEYKCCKCGKIMYKNPDNYSTWS